MHERSVSSKMELLMLAEANLAAGTPETDASIEAYGRVEPTNAAMLATLARIQRGELDDATTRVETTVQLLQRDPWISLEILRRFMGSVRAIADNAPNFAPRLLAALDKPFSVYLLEADRLRTRLHIQTVVGPSTRCAEVFEPYGKNVPWEGPVLAFRNLCYEKTGHIQGPLAKAELIDFASHAETPFWPTTGGHAAPADDSPQPVPAASEATVTH
jgi:hypothetical protein